MDPQCRHPVIFVYFKHCIKRHRLSVRNENKKMEMSVSADLLEKMTPAQGTQMHLNCTLHRIISQRC